MHLVRDSMHIGLGLSVQDDGAGVKDCIRIGSTCVKSFISIAPQGGWIYLATNEIVDTTHTFFMFGTFSCNLMRYKLHCI